MVKRASFDVACFAWQPRESTLWAEEYTPWLEKIVLAEAQLEAQFQKLLFFRQF